MCIKVTAGFVLAWAVLGLVGCHDPSSSGGDDLTQQQPVSGGPVTTLEFYQGSLFAVPPSSPGSDFLVDENAASATDEDNDQDAGPFPVVGGTCHDGQFRSAHVKSVAYARDDGTLFRVFTDPDSTPTPTRVSSESNASPVCDVRVGQDFSDHENSRIVYGLAGPDCSDPTDWNIVQLGDDATTAPRDFPGRPVFALNDLSDGSHSGWLIVEGGELKRLDANNDVQADGLATVNNFASTLGQLGNGLVFLNIDGNLHAFDRNQNVLTDLNFAFTNQFPTGAGSDGNELYFVDDQRLLRTEIASNAIITLDDPADSASSLTLPLLQIGADRAVWKYIRQDPETGEFFDVLRTVDKTATGTGSAQDLDTVNLQDGQFTVPTSGLIANTPDWVFYTELDNNTNQPTAIAKRMDDSATETFTNALWLGGGLASDFAVGSKPVSRVYRLDGLTDITSNWGGLAVKSVAPEDPGATPIDLGPLPADIQQGGFLPGFEPDRLAFVLSDDGTGNDSDFDVVYFDETAAGSLLRLTDTNGLDEIPVALF